MLKRQIISCYCSSHQTVAIIYSTLQQVFLLLPLTVGYIATYKNTKSLEVGLIHPIEGAIFGGEKKPRTQIAHFLLLFEINYKKNKIYQI